MSVSNFTSSSFPKIFEINILNKFVSFVSLFLKLVTLFTFLHCGYLR